MQRCAPYDDPSRVRFYSERWRLPDIVQSKICTFWLVLVRRHFKLTTNFESLKSDNQKIFKVKIR